MFHARDWKKLRAVHYQGSQRLPQTVKASGVSSGGNSDFRVQRVIWVNFGKGHLSRAATGLTSTDGQGGS